MIVVNNGVYNSFYQILSLILISFISPVRSLDGLSFQDAVIETIASNEATCGSYGSPDWELLPIEDCSGIPCKFPYGICRYNFIDDIFSCFEISGQCQKVLKLAELLDEDPVKSISDPILVTAKPPVVNSMKFAFPTRIRPLRVQNRGKNDENPAKKGRQRQTTSEPVITTTTHTPPFRFPAERVEEARTVHNSTSHDYYAQSGPEPTIRDRNPKLFTPSAKSIRIIRLPPVNSNEILTANKGKDLLDFNAEEQMLRKQAISDITDNINNRHNDNNNRDSLIDNILDKRKEDRHARDKTIDAIIKGVTSPPKDTILDSTIDKIIAEDEDALIDQLFGTQEEPNPVVQTLPAADRTSHLQTANIQFSTPLQEIPWSNGPPLTENYIGQSKQNTPERRPTIPQPPARYSHRQAPSRPVNPPKIIHRSHNDVPNRPPVRRTEPQRPKVFNPVPIDTEWLHRNSQHNQQLPQQRSTPFNFNAGHIPKRQQIPSIQFSAPITAQRHNFERKPLPPPQAPPRKRPTKAIYLLQPNTPNKKVDKNPVEGKDYHKFCCYWAQQGHCYSNGRFTRPVCQKSCGTPHCTENRWESCLPKIARECQPAPTKKNVLPTTLPLSKSTKVKLRLLSVNHVPLDEITDRRILLT